MPVQRGDRARIPPPRGAQTLSVGMLLRMRIHGGMIDGFSAGPCDLASDKHTLLAQSNTPHRPQRCPPPGAEMP